MPLLLSLPLFKLRHQTNFKKKKKKQIVFLCERLIVLVSFLPIS